MVRDANKSPSWSALFATAALAVVGCQDAGFRGGGNQGAQNGGDGFARPETNKLERPGWLNPKSTDDWKKIFDEATIGSEDPRNRPGIQGGGDNGTPGTGPGTNGSSPSDQLLSGVDGVLWIPCGDDPSDNKFNAEFGGKAGSRVRLSGEFCPSGKASEITVLFVIDHSGSMEVAASGEGPNDPTSSSGCRRLEASKVLIEKYEALKSTDVRVGVVNFASQATVAVPLSDLSDMKKRLNSATFCGLQPGLGTMTNYQDAFTFAKRALKDIEGPKVVYFITDGSPTTSGTGGRADGNISTSESAGLAAAKSLRELDDLTLNALFVGYKGGVAKNPQGYLESITGDPDAVRVTKDADELLKAAASLPVSAVKISKDDTTITLKNPNGESRVGVARLALSPSKVGVYIWVTDPFVLVGSKDQEVTNTLTAKAKTSTGDELKSVANIKFQQID